MSYSSWNHLLLYEGCVNCYRGAGRTDLLISLYQSAGSPPALGIRLTDKSSRLAITLSHSALAAAQSRTPSPLYLSRLPLFQKPFYMCLICYFILIICPGFLEFAMSSFSKVICLSILKFEFVYYMESKMWYSETNA